MYETFSQPVNRRGTDSLKWDRCEQVFGRDDILPLWVADSDWPTAPEVLRALGGRLEHGILGYTRPSGALDGIVTRWVERRYGWKVQPEWLVYTSGVVPSLHTAVRAYTRPGESIVIQPPVYRPFFSVITDNGARVATNKLVREHGTYRMDLENLEATLSAPARRVRALILCNPHNPVGRVWRRGELSELARLCLENGVIMLSDDIHADLVYGGERHTMLPTLSREVEENSVTMISPGKTLNIAGLHIAVVIIPDPQKRRRFEKAAQNILPQGSVMGLTALEAAYSGRCDRWIASQLAYLETNRDYALRFIAGAMDRIRAPRPEGTYLLWVDFRKLKLDDEALQKLMVERARVGLNPGTWFGPGGSGFMRLNFACPRSTLEEGLERIAGAVASL